MHHTQLHIFHSQLWPNLIKFILNFNHQSGDILISVSVLDFVAAAMQTTFWLINSCVV